MVIYSYPSSSTANQEAEEEEEEEEEEEIFGNSYSHRGAPRPAEFNGA